MRRCLHHLDAHAGALLVRVDEKCDAGQAGYELLEELQALAGEVASEIGHARDVSPRPRNVLDQLQSHRIGNEHEYDRDFCRGVPQIRRCNRTAHENIDVQRHELGGHALEPLGHLVGEAMFELEVSPLDIAEPGEALADRFEIRGLLVRAAGMPEITDRGNFPALLRASREWPRGRCAANECNEIAASYHAHSVMRGLDPRIHLLAKKDGLPGQARQ